MRTLLVAVSIAAVLGSAASAQSPQRPAAYGEALFVVSGRGYGHGVGMSQYGALGQAKAGRTHDQILSHYYSGTRLGRVSRKAVRVLLAEGRRAVTIGSAVRYRITDAAGKTYRLAPGPLTLDPDLTLPAPEGRAAVEQPEAVPPLLVVPGKATAPLSLDGKPYRGKLELDVQGGYLRVVNDVGLESYLQGVVAGEMPFGWPAEALEAQAVAARSYALANLVEGKPFDLYADVRSQVYSGVAGEKPATTAAVKRTAGEVVTYEGKVASTLYFSSSGGKTASAADVFGVSIPYLVSRPDPWDRESPYFRWGPLLLGARTVQAKLGVDARVIDARATGTPSGRIRSLAVTTTAGTEAVPASLVRSALGLRSTWITVGVARLDRPVTGAIVFGSRVELAGIARGLEGATLSTSSDGATWTDGTPLEPDASGDFSLEARPARTMRYRIEAGTSASPAQLVQVSPRVQLVQPPAPDVLTGSVRPKLPGAIVTVERRKGSAWAAVASGVVDAGGGFRVELPLAPGAYRASIGATKGLGEARSPVLQVTG